MRTSVLATIGAGPLAAISVLAVAVAAPEEKSQEGNAPLIAQVIVVRATNACFSEALRVTGYLVAREQAVVQLAPGDRVVDVLAQEGTLVTLDQTLARVERQSPDPSKPGGGVKTDTVALKAPAAGIVIASTASVGSTLVPIQQAPLFVIAVDGEIELQAEVPSIHVPQLSPGQTARIQIRDTRELSGRVRLLPAEIDQKTQLGDVRISLERDSNLRFGMFARASIDAARSCGVSVPSSAVTYQTGGTTVQVVRDNVIETRNVQVGIHSGGTTEVRSGLSEGDIIVANAGTSLRDGDRVKPIDGDSTKAEAH
jgi:HlyD family secretion protein